MKKPIRMASMAVFALAFLVHGASADCTEWNSQQFFEAADPEAVRNCLEGGANVQEMNSHGITPLHWAAGYSVNPAILQTLLEAGADVYARDIKGRTPLHWAASGSQDPTIVRTLLGAGADIHAEDVEGYTPLHEAASFNQNPAILQELLSVGVDPRTWNAGYVLRSAASSQDNVEVLQLLLDLRVVRDNINSPSKSSGATALHYAANSNENPAIIQTLLTFGADPNSRDDKGRTPLHWAAYRNGNPAVLQKLIEAGADIDAQDIKGRTPLWDAARTSTPNVAALQLLLQNGADPNREELGWGITVLYWAAVNERHNVLRELLASGADHCIQDDDGRTPLERVERGTYSSEIVELLRAAGRCP